MSPELKGQLKAGFFKLLPALSTALVLKGAITQEQGNALVNNAQIVIDWLSIVAGIAGYVWTAIYSWWANRSEKKIADVAKLPEVQNVVVTDQKLADKLPNNVVAQ